MSQPVCVILVEGFADWEAAFAMAELRRTCNIGVKTASPGGTTVQSMGGLRVQPDFEAEKLDPADFSLLMLPGADAWTGRSLRGVYSAIERFAEAQTPIAAICGATIALARLGLLDDRPHTSNGLDFLKEHAPAYNGGIHYTDEPVVRDGDLITASGLCAVDFAAEIFRHFLPGNEPDIAAYQSLMKGVVRA